MKNLINKFSLSVLVGGEALLSAQTGLAAIPAVALTASPYTKTLIPGQATVPMWGFSGGALPTTPGLQISVNQNQDTLQITLSNAPVHSLTSQSLNC